LKTKFKKLTQNKFARNVAIVATGTAGAQAITMAFAPLITRIYGPEDFGLLGVFMALNAILTPIAALTYPTAIVLPKEDADAKGIAKLAFWIALTISTITAIILFFVGEAFLKLIGSEAILAYVMLIPLAMFFAAMLQITQHWLIRKKQFKITAKIAIAQALIINSAKTGFGWLNPTAAVLIIITTLGAALHAAMMALGVKRNANDQAKINTDYTAVTPHELAYKYNDFPLYQMPQQVMNAISQSMPMLMLASFFGPVIAGFYAIGKLVLGVPSTLIAKSVGDVFYPHIAEAGHNKENLTHLILKATMVLVGVGFFPFFIVIAFGPRLFGFVFGSEWIIAGEYARWLAVWMFFAFLNPPSIKAIIVLRLQYIAIILNIITIGLRAGGIVFGALYLQSALASVILFSVAGVVHNILFISIAIYGSKNISNYV